MNKIYVLSEVDYESRRNIFVSHSLKSIENKKKQCEDRQKLLEKLAEQLREKMEAWSEQNKQPENPYDPDDLMKWADSKYAYYDLISDPILIEYHIKYDEDFYENYSAKFLDVEQIDCDDEV